MALSYWKGQDIKNAKYPKYERPLSYGKKIMSNVQKYVKDRMDDHL